MQIHFSKYQGTGNDFILIDNRRYKMQLNSKQIAALCDRKFGIGSDGIILIEEDAETEFYMNFYNPDGTQSFCGNGSRCAIHFFTQSSLEKKRLLYRAIDGKHHAVVAQDEIQINMKEVNTIQQWKADLFFIDTGSPHVVSLQQDARTFDLIPFAQKIRYSEAHREKGVNVNAMSFLADDTLFVRTYERGVEAETLSCGTGVTAAALVAGYLNQQLTAVQVETKGGHLKVIFQQKEKGKFDEVWLCGPAAKIFDGMIEI